ncbi:hypothetical protein C8J30_101252 [Rhodobacter viridis]|uniref:Secreted protein n=1 Tax=Rhodobacter viridis TaxID=1054202 RepID=A0A318U320_9RHOB|nr:hypothetical protein [Rhodobacter viridis]PYF12870.1 hypothetical protein C8J30_101252 [Rhodobacter viridis]
MKLRTTLACALALGIAALGTNPSAAQASTITVEGASGTGDASPHVWTTPGVGYFLFDWDEYFVTTFWWGDLHFRIPVGAATAGPDELNDIIVVTSIPPENLRVTRRTEGGYHYINLYFDPLDPGTIMHIVSDFTITEITPTPAPVPAAGGLLVGALGLLGALRARRRAS